MRPMRRAFQQVEDRMTLERWLDEGKVGRLATVDEDGYATIKPVNYVYSDGKIFFHSAPEGEKLDDIRRDARVGFEVDELIAITPPIDVGCQTHSFYQSILIRGSARILDNVEERAAKEMALRLLVKKYAPAFRETSLSDIDKAVVVEITVERMSGKEDFGQKWPVERKLTVARMLLESEGASAAAAAIAGMGLTLEQVTGIDG